MLGLMMLAVLAPLVASFTRSSFGIEHKSIVLYRANGFLARQIRKGGGGKLRVSYEKGRAVAMVVSRQDHNKLQTKKFDDSVEWFASPDAVAPEVVPKLRIIAKAATAGAHKTAPDKTKMDYRLVDVGTGTGALLPYYAECGVPPCQVTGVDLSPKLLAVFRERFPEAAAVEGDFLDYWPPSLSSKEGEILNTDEDKVDSIVFNACFGNLYDPADHLCHASDMLRTGGSIVISHPLGSACPRDLREQHPDMVPHTLPTAEELIKSIRNLPLVLNNWQDGPASSPLYLAVLSRVRAMPLKKRVYVAGIVGTGFGRGGKKLGIPTANLAPDGDGPLRKGLENLDTGVYMGWAKVLTGEVGGGPVYKTVVNVGFSPTFEDRNSEKIIEAHLIRYKGEDFYGQPLKILLAAYLRPEKKFSNFGELVAAINYDVKDAADTLEIEPYASLSKHPFFDAVEYQTWERRE